MRDLGFCKVGRSLKSVDKKKPCYECPKGTGGFKT